MSSVFSLRPCEPVCLKEQALRQWVLRHLGTIAHEQRVSDIAVKLYDLTWPLHGLGRRGRRTLRLAALVHDVGRAIDDDTHPREGARMIREATDLPLTASQRRALAYLTRRHRGSVPDPALDKYLGPRDDADLLRLLLALLRAADSLDSRSLESPRLVFGLNGRRLQITCYLDTDSPRARKVYSRRKKFRLLEELLDVRVEVCIARAQALQMVA